MVGGSVTSVTTTIDRAARPRTDLYPLLLERVKMNAYDSACYAAGVIWLVVFLFMFVVGLLYG